MELVMYFVDRFISVLAFVIPIIDLDSICNLGGTPSQSPFILLIKEKLLHYEITANNEVDNELRQLIINQISLQNPNRQLHIIHQLESFYSIAIEFQPNIDQLNALESDTSNQMLSTKRTLEYKLEDVLFALG